MAASVESGLAATWDGNTVGIVSARARKPKLCLENHTARRLDPGMAESQETQAKQRKWRERS